MEGKIFKVVKKVGGRRRSAIISLKGVSVSYSKNKWAEPKIQPSKLFAFSSFSSAKAFKDSPPFGGNSEIWEAKGEGIVRAEKMLSLDEIPVFKKRAIEDWWRGQIFNSIPPPKDTVFCDRIRLLRKIE